MAPHKRVQKTAVLNAFFIRYTTIQESREGMFQKGSFRKLTTLLIKVMKYTGSKEVTRQQEKQKHIQVLFMHRCTSSSPIRARSIPK